MYQLDFDIEFNNAGRKFKLALLVSVDIEKNVELLADSCIIILPEAVLNKVLDIESKISRGTSVTVSLGYDGNLKREFDGYIQEIQTNNSTLKIVCEDSLFLFRKAVTDIELKGTSVSKIAQYLIDQLEPTYKLVCDFDLGFEKFTIHQATAFDVLKKLADDTKANIYFKSSEKELHIRAPFKEKGGEVKYAMDRNIESSSLEYKRALDRKVEVTVESVGKDGSVKSVKSGTTGGDSITIKVGEMTEADIQKIADAELIKHSADRFEGSFDAWLVPYIEPTATVKLKDNDYPEKDGSYYVKAVKTSFSSSGGKRTIELGIKLG